MNQREYYLMQLNKIANISKHIAESVVFSDYVACAYEENGDESTDESIGYVALLHLFLNYIEDITLNAEFQEMMKDYDLNKIFTSTLRECSESIVIKNGILIDLKNEDAL